MGPSSLNQPPGGSYPAEKLNFDVPEPPKRRQKNWKDIASTVGLFLLAPVVALSLAAFVIQSYQVDGQSMETTLQNNDRLIVDKVPRTWARITGHSYIPKRGDIIIFNQSGVSFAGQASKQLIKRVIGLPGERVVVSDGRLTVYNAQNPSGFNPDGVGKYKLASAVTPGNVDITLKSNELFVSGDNRANSEDSRYFGPINASQVVGKLSFRILPLSKAQHF